MKTIILIRHAKSDWSILGQKDFNRKLAPRGEKQAKSLAKIFQNLDTSADKIFCSTANRAKLTYQILAKNSKNFSKIPTEFTDEIYDLMEESGEDFLDFIRFFDDKYDKIIIIGHNNVFDKFLQITTGNILYIPTATLVEIRFESESWTQIHRGKLFKFIKPS